MLGVGQMKKITYIAPLFLASCLVPVLAQEAEASSYTATGQLEQINGTRLVIDGRVYQAAPKYRSFLGYNAKVLEGARITYQLENGRITTIEALAINRVKDQVLDGMNLHFKHIHIAGLRGLKNLTTKDLSLGEGYTDEMTVTNIKVNNKATLANSQHKIYRLVNSSIYQLYQYQNGTSIYKDIYSQVTHLNLLANTKFYQAGDKAVPYTTVERNVSTFEGSGYFSHIWLEGEQSFTLGSKLLGQMYVRALHQTRQGNLTLKEAVHITNLYAESPDYNLTVSKASTIRTLVMPSYLLIDRYVTNYPHIKNHINHYDTMHQLAVTRSYADLGHFYLDVNTDAPDRYEVMYEGIGKDGVVPFKGERISENVHPYVEDRIRYYPDTTYFVYLIDTETNRIQQIYRVPLDEHRLPWYHVMIEEETMTVRVTEDQRDKLPQDVLKEVRLYKSVDEYDTYQDFADLSWEIKDDVTQVTLPLKTPFIDYFGYTVVTHDGGGGEVQRASYAFLQETLEGDTLADVYSFKAALMKLLPYDESIHYKEEYLRAYREALLDQRYPISTLSELRQIIKDVNEQML